MKKRFFLLLAAGLFAVALVAFFSIDGTAKSKFVAGTTINGIDVSGMTKEDLEKEIQSYSIDVVYRDEQGKSASEAISGLDFDMALGGNADKVSEILQNQDIGQYLTGQGESYTLDHLIEYDENKLGDVIDQLGCFDETRFTAPEDAYISEYSKTTGYQIVRETAGNILDREKARREIFDAVASMEHKVDLTEGDCYQTAAVTSKDAELNEVARQLNTYAGAEITYRFGSKKEVLDGTTISTWLKVNKKGKVILNKEKVKEFVAELRRKYDTIFTNRNFKTSYGKTVRVIGGDYGWWMDTQKESKELLKLIKAGSQVKRTPEYFQTAQSYGKKDYGNSYVEINLATQHVFLYIDGKKVLETDCVTGNAARGYSTPAGTYSITYTERNATLNGENYSTPVKYWMPFNRNIGLHDASWRSSFGGEIYKYNGSHGCVNLPPDKAEKLFGYVKKGMPVICYSYTPKKSSKDSSSTQNNSTSAKKNSSTQNNNTSAKKNSSTQNNNTSAKKNSSTQNNNTSAKKNSSTQNKNTSAKKSNSSKKSNSTKNNNNAQKKNKVVQNQGY